MVTRYTATQRKAQAAAVSERLWQEHQRIMRDEGLDKEAAWKRLYNDEQLMRKCHDVGPLESR